MCTSRTWFATGILLAAAGLSRAATVYTYNEDGKIDTFSVATTGIYTIDGIGGSGGGNGTYNGGYGAEVDGNFLLTAGEQLSILVGASSSEGADYLIGGGGGGGTYVMAPGDLPLSIAGGGGGSARSSNGQSGGDISLGTAYGGGGGGGHGGSTGGGGGGGGGFDLNGNGSSGSSSNGGGNGGFGGKSFLDAGAGGAKGVGGTIGGFGGGGGGASYTGGGGGGAIGGNGADDGNSGSAGASYLNSDFGTLDYYGSATSFGDGMVTITFVPTQQGAVPAPAALPAGAMLLGGLWAGQWRRSKRRGRVS